MTYAMTESPKIMNTERFKFNQTPIKQERAQTCRNSVSNSKTKNKSNLKLKRAQSNVA